MRKRTIDTTTIGGRIKERRIALGITQAEFAELLFLDGHQAISLYENNQRGVSVETLGRMADVLQVTTDYLIKGEECSYVFEMTRLMKQMNSEELRRIAVGQIRVLSAMGQ